MVLRLRCRVFRAAAALGHELVELDLVLGVAQPVEKFHELALLFFEPAQGFGAVFVKGAVAGRARLIMVGRRSCGNRPRQRSAAACIRSAPLHVLGSRCIARRSMRRCQRSAALRPACHPSTPYQAETRPSWPPQDKGHTVNPIHAGLPMSSNTSAHKVKPQDGQPDRCRLADVVQMRREVMMHGRTYVNVSNIYIYRAPALVKHRLDHSFGSAGSAMTPSPRR